MKKVILGSAVALALGTGFSSTANAALASNATLLMGDQQFGCSYNLGTYPDCMAGSYVDGNFFAMDTDGSGAFETTERTGISAGTDGGITLGSTQGVGAIDATWGFFNNPGNHITLSAITVASDDGVGNATLDMSGWRVFWNNVTIDMGQGAAATVTCGNTCENGDTFTLNYAASVPDDGTTNFGNVPYALQMVGTISSAPAEVPVPAAVWLFGSGLVGLAGIARRRKAA
ncbi:MAG TPA: VPLPA-CTERM sorting domain-containing protein [Gammaproteobacteria bacterium]